MTKFGLLALVLVFEVVLLDEEANLKCMSGLETFVKGVNGLMKNREVGTLDVLGRVGVNTSRRDHIRMRGSLV